ncbi:LysR family transcriptional regulator ArgP [Desertihabitans aurantiacus]|uniref:LysR family transcriptional regulator ArgP n=1 Tax=Desertihabitans aurantiacus TaxID=2282477 RepID=UPI000DF7FF44|nr:LysR family transcriptional regulator ArgP [Desertihabitans aurantiacus]
MDLDLAGVTTLVAVVRTGSFEAAARELRLTPSAVSQRVRGLETRVGRVLLRRTRPVVATEAGEVLLRLGGQLELLVDEAVEELRVEAAPASRPPVLPVAVNADSLATWLLPVLAELHADQGVTFELLRDDEHHSAELLRQGRVLGAVTADPVPVQGCRSVPLGVLRYRALAAPSWVARWGAPPRQVEHAPLVVFDPRDTLQHRVLAHRGHPHAQPPTTSVPSSWDFDRAVRMGLGWGMLPEPGLGDAVERGELVPLWDDGELDVALWWQHWRLDSPLLRTLTEAVQRGAAAVLHPPRP